VAVDQGVAFVVPQLGLIDVASASLFDYLYRNWGVAGLSGVREQAEQRARQGGLVDDEALLARLVLEGSAVPDIPEGTEPTTEVLAAALHCDEREMDSADLGRLRRLVRGGEYETTHAALAIGWMGELGCPVPEGLRQEAIDRVSAELTNSPSGPITDLATEQSALLVYLGEASLVPDDWTTRVLNAQRPDGGWGEEPGPSTWHMTLLALWTLEGLRSSGTGVPMILDAAPGT
jgi:hypothetical protein